MFWHSFDFYSPICVSGKRKEGEKPFSFYFPQLALMHTDLFGQHAVVSGLDFAKHGFKRLARMGLAQDFKSEYR